MMAKMLTIDMSTTCSGWALFDIKTRSLVDFGAIKPVKKGTAKLTYPKKQVMIIRSLAEQLVALVKSIGPDTIAMILIEEVNRGVGRLSQKTLDGAHFMVMDAFEKAGFIDKVRFVNSDGKVGWRPRLGLVLSDMDKKVNEKHRALNKKKAKGQPDHVIINKKHLAARYVNSKLGLGFDVDADPVANDICDAIAIGLSEFLTMR